MCGDGLVELELNSTPTYVDWGESDNIQTMPECINAIEHGYIDAV